jgi:hypothetical protein
MMRACFTASVEARSASTDADQALVFVAGDRELQTLPLSQWPDGVCESAALLNLDIAVVSERLNAAIESGSDNLDDFDAVLVQMKTGGVVALRQYRNMPIGAVDVVTKAGASNNVREIGRILDINRSDVAWSADWARPALESAIRLNRAGLFRAIDRAARQKRSRHRISQSRPPIAA